MTARNVKLPSGRRRAERLSKGDQRERELLDSAEAVLASTDARDLTIEAVAVGAGLSRSSVYFYFDGTDAIIDALVERASAEMIATFAPTGNGDVPGLGAFAESATHAVFTSWRRHKAVFLAAAERSTRDSSFRRRWIHINEQFADALADVVEAERSRGTLPHTMDAQQAASLVCWMVERNCYLLFSRRHTAREEKELQKAIIELTMLAFGGA